MTIPNTNTIDPITISFIDNTGQIINSIPNWTNYKISRSFFGGPDTFTLTCEDDRADQLLNQIAIGMKVTFSIDLSGGASSILVGFIDSFDIAPKRGSSGKILSIQGRDRLGMLADSSLYPNLGSTTIQQTYHFQPTDSLEKVIQTIFKSAPGIETVNVDDDVAGLTGATGFGIGVRNFSKTGRGLARNFQNNLNHLLKPEKGETYLGYATRICIRAGCQIKMVPGSDSTINVAPPVYDRAGSHNTTPGPNGKVMDNPFDFFKGLVGQPSFTINRFTVNNTIQNNVLDSKMRIDYKNQPSIIIAEGSHGGPTFKKVIKKIICINELTGYERNPNTKLTLKNAIPSVQQAVDVLTSGTNGYKPLNPNQDLYDAIPNTIANLQTAVSRPLYVVDYNSQTDEELQFYVSELMAHYQDKYFTLEYEVLGHSQGDYVWAPNLMCTVHDESFHPTKSIDSTFWIEKVEFSRDVSSGCKTRITLKLPYTRVYGIKK